MKVKLQIWDTAGEERFRSVAPMYYKNAAAIILVYDSTNKGSFDGLNRWLEEIDNNATEDLWIVAVTASKCDQIGYQDVTTEEAINFAKEKDSIFAETSAKINEGVSELFHRISRKLYFIHHQVKLLLTTYTIDYRP